MLKQLLICYIAIQQTTQSCKKGCLSCNTSNQCILCDLSSDYYLNTTSNSCDLASTENCVGYNTQGVCTVCGPSHYVNNAKCAAVASEKLLANTNCLVWSTAQNCIGCKTNYLLEGTTCKQVTSPLANCSDHLSQTQCDTCKSGFELSETKTCVALPTASNCQFFGDFTCETCKGNYFNNPNLYSINYTPTGNLQTLLALAENSAVNYANQAVCQLVTDLNCLVHSAHDVCSACMPNYYLLQNGTCQKNPETIIPNCDVYSSNTVCYTCATDFYLKASKCSAVTPVTGCGSYHKSSDECLSCSDNNQKLTGTKPSQLCETRTATVADCQIHEAKGDNCIQCAARFEANGAIPTNECVPYNDPNNIDVNECEVVQITTVNGKKQVSCASCKEGFYRQNHATATGVQVCIAGDTAKNCKIFKDTVFATSDLSQCDLCNEGFYVGSNNACTEHPNKVTNCSRHSNVVADQCESCSDNYFASIISKNCISTRTEIPDCEEYDNTGNTVTCTKCMNNKYLSSTSCLPITQVPNCLQANDGKDPHECTLCADNYALQRKQSESEPKDYKCASYAESLKQYCDNTFTTDSFMWSQVTCDHCQTSAVPMNMINHAVCVKRTNLLVLDQFVDGIDASNNCAVFKEGKSDGQTPVAPKCIQCVSGYGLDANDACVSITGNDCVSYELLKVNTNNITQRYVCSTANENNGVKFAAWSNEGDSIAISCLDTKVKLVAAGTKITNVNPETSNGTSVNIDSFASIYPEISCSTPVAGDTFNSSSDTMIPNCDMYSKTDTNYVCMRCINGKTGSTADKLTCSASANCVSNVKNVPSKWYKLASCHQCTSTTPAEIPYVALDMSKNDHTMFKQISFQEEGWTILQNGRSNYHGCTQETVSEMKLYFGLNTILTVSEPITLGQTAGEIPLGCGLIVINTNAPPVVKATQADTLRCGYCKSGFKPTYDGDYVTQCVPIEDCGTTMINGCEVCNGGFGFEMNADDGVIDYTVCKKMTGDVNVHANCHAFMNNLCVICKKGYSIDRDGKCEQLSGPNCPDSNFIVKNEYLTTPTVAGTTTKEKSTAANILLRNYLVNYGNGCSQCSDTTNFAAVLLETGGNSEKVLQTQYCVNRRTNPTALSAIVNEDSNYILQCAKYKNNSGNGQLQCAECNATYVLTTNQMCVRDSTINGCELFGTYQTDSSQQECSRCKAGFGRFDQNGRKVCQVVSDSFCETADTTGTADTPKCSSCKTNYYLNTTTGRCELGQIDHCKTMVNDSSTSCTTCEDGYTKLTGISQTVPTGSGVNRDYCIQIPTSSITGCTNVSAEKLGSALVFQCVTCTDAWQKVVQLAENTETSYCAPFNLVHQCSKYQVNVPEVISNFGSEHFQNLDNTNFACKQCNDTHYVEIDTTATINKKLGYSCKDRVQTLDLANCQVYDYYLDKCKTCTEGYFLNTQKTECIINPSGELGCETWRTDESKKRICTSCDTTAYFLLNGVCTKPTEVIENCAVVANLTSCETCAKNHILINEKDPSKNETVITNYCKSVTTLGECKQFASSDSCSICQDGFKKQQVGTTGNFKCVTSSVPGCLLFTAEKCTTCDPGKYLVVDNAFNTCSNPTQVTNCKIYSSQTDCQECQDDYALAVNKRSCIKTSTVSNWDVNCMVQTQGTTKVCSQCKPGYEFKDGNCTALTGKQAPSAGCLVQNVVDREKCLVCKPTHYQNSSQVCVENNPNTIPQPTNAGIKALFMAVMGLLMLF